jgi:hypothetical protein
VFLLRLENVFSFVVKQFERFLNMGLLRLAFFSPMQKSSVLLSLSLGFCLKVYRLTRVPAVCFVGVAAISV